MVEPGSSRPSDTAPAAAAELLGTLRMAVAQMKLYPKESPQVAKVAVGVHAAVEGFLQSAGEFTMGAAAEGLLVNGKRLPVTDAAGASLEAFGLGLLQECRIRSFRIGDGTGAPELLTFLHALAQRFWDLQDGKEINRRLAEEGVSRIQVDEVEYVAVGKQDLLVKDAAAALGVQDAGELLDALRVRLDAMSEGGQGPAVRMKIMRALVEQDPSILRRVQEEDPPPMLLQDALAATGFEEARKAVGGLWKALQQAGPEADPLIRKAAATLLDGFRPHLRLRRAMREALSQEAPGLMPSWMATDEGAGEAAPVARAKAVLAMPPGIRAEAIAREGAVLVRELFEAGEHGLSGRVLDLLFESLAEGSVQRRKLASESLLSMKHFLDSEKMARFRASLESRVQTRLDQEKDPEAYARLADLAAFLAESRLRKKQVNEALRLLDVLKRHSTINDAVFPERSRLALPILERVTAGQGYAAATGAVRGMDAASARLHEAMDRAAIEFLIREMKDLESAAERHKLAQAISKSGDAAPPILCGEIRKSRVPSEAVRLLEILPGFVPVGLAEETLIEFFQSHPLPTVRKRSAALLAEKGYPKARDLLLGAFGNPKDPAARADAAEALAKLKDPAALAALTEAAGSRSEADEFRALCCGALGRSGNPSAAAILGELATHQAKGLTRLFRATSPALRLAATRALAALLPDPGVVQLLMRLLDDADIPVRTAAAQGLGAASKARKTAAEPAAEAPAPAQGDAMAGMLGTIPFDQVCQMIAASQRNGLLKIRGDGEEGKVYFAGGAVVQADFRGKEGQEAFNLLFANRRGAFYFSPEAKPSRPGPPAPLTAMLMEAARVADEAAVRE